MKLEHQLVCPVSGLLSSLHLYSLCLLSTHVKMARLSWVIVLNAEDSGPLFRRSTILKVSYSESLLFPLTLSLTLRLTLTLALIQILTLTLTLTETLALWSVSAQWTFGITDLWNSGPVLCWDGSPNPIQYRSGQMHHVSVHFLLLSFH